MDNVVWGERTPQLDFRLCAATCLDLPSLLVMVIWCPWHYLCSATADSVHEATGSYWIALEAGKPQHSMHLTKV